MQLLQWIEPRPFFRSYAALRTLFRPYAARGLLNYRQCGPQASLSLRPLP